MPSYDPSTNVALMSDPIFKKPTSFRAFGAFPKGFVMQDIVYKNGGDFFATQGPDSNVSGIDNTIINRLSYDTGQPISAMELTYGGHGLGFEIEKDSSGKFWVWMTWQGTDNQNEFCRFPYKPGTYTKDQVKANGGFTSLPVQDGPEAVYHFDWTNDLALERHYEFDGSGETYKLRHISDLKNGVNQVYSQFKLPTNPPTVQGFAVIQGAMFRWVGKAIDNDTPNSSDKVQIEQYRLSDGAWLGTNTYQTSTSNSISSNGTNSSGKPTWRDGHFEAEGMSAFREADGTYSLIIGDTTGDAGNHAWHCTKFTGVGGPNGR
jgi:hypothetical protein